MGIVKEWTRSTILSSKLLVCLFENTIPSWMRRERGRQDRQDQATPKSGEGVNENRFAVEKIEEPVIEHLLQA